MAHVELKNVNKIYDNGFQAVYDFNMEIQDKEFIVFVGPSGCGKSTTLRMIAGLEEITGGDLYIDGKEMNFTAPKDRNIAMVFQSYALYPHMTVFKNMAFSLKIRKCLLPKLDKEGNQVIGIDEVKIRKLQLEENKIESSNTLTLEEKQHKIDEIEEEIKKIRSEEVPLFVNRHYTKKEINERVSYAAKILGLEEYLDSKPRALSGGQRQRVALGRAIVRNPKLFLMDEPLSNLDAKLRIQMRAELINIHKKVEATTIYVTHDQVEAMTMADRIVVMKDGYIQQIGAPYEIYSNPVNMFVGGFIGSPAMKFLTVKVSGNKLILKDGQSIELDANQKEQLKDYNNKEIALGLRCEFLTYQKDENYPKNSQVLNVNVNIVELLGESNHVHGFIDDEEIIVKAEADGTKLKSKLIKVMLRSEKMQFFDLESTNRIK